MKIQEELIRIKEVMGLTQNSDDFINEALEYTLVLYHGTPFLKSAQGIIKHGLKTSGDFIIAGGSGSPSIQNRSYITSELWNAIRYSFYKPDKMKQNWDEFVTEEPYGYVFKFQKNIDDLLPDEDAIGELVSTFLFTGDNSYMKKYLEGVDEELLDAVKKGSFEAYAELGKLIEPKLSHQDKLTIIKNSTTFTTDQDLIPTDVYIVKKPPTQFFNDEDEYLRWFEQNSTKKRINS